MSLLRCGSISARTRTQTHTRTHTHTHTQRSGIRLLSRARQPIHAFSLFRSISCFFLPSCFLPLFPFLFALVARTNYTSVRPSPHFVVRLKYILHIPRCNRCLVFIVRLSGSPFLRRDGGRPVEKINNDFLDIPRVSMSRSERSK